MRNQLLFVLSLAWDNICHWSNSAIGRYSEQLFHSWFLYTTYVFYVPWSCASSFVLTWVPSRSWWSSSASGLFQEVCHPFTEWIMFIYLVPHKTCHFLGTMTISFLILGIREQKDLPDRYYLHKLNIHSYMNSVKHKLSIKRNLEAVYICMWLFFVFF